jgi:plasmid stabilization system protein ParE
MGPTYQIVLSTTAQDNLRDIYDYLYDHVSFETAEHVKDGLEAEIAKLSQSPEANGLLQGHNSKTVYRRVLKWSYRIIFSIEEQQLTVEIIRVDSQKMNPVSLEDLP